MSALEQELPNGRRAADNLRISCGQPSAEQLRAVCQDGVCLVINLRPEGEFKDFDERALAEDIGVDYICIPVAGPQDLTVANAERLDAALTQAKGRPVLVHCGSGNRVGALTALRAGHVLGQDRATALREGLDAGLDRSSPLFDATQRALD